MIFLWIQRSLLNDKSLMLFYEKSHETYMQGRKHQGGNQREHEEKPRLRMLLLKYTLTLFTFLNDSRRQPTSTTRDLVEEMLNRGLGLKWIWEGICMSRGVRQLRGNNNWSEYENLALAPPEDLSMSFRNKFWAQYMVCHFQPSMENNFSSSRIHYQGYLFHKKKRKSLLESSV